MKQVGAWNIAIGVTLIVLGVLSGVMTIVNGARLIKDKSDIMFQETMKSTVFTFHGNKKRDGAVSEMKFCDSLISLFKNIRYKKKQPVRKKRQKSNRNKFENKKIEQRK